MRYVYIVNNKSCTCSREFYSRIYTAQNVRYTAQNVRPRVRCAKSALYGTKCTLESGMCKKRSIQHKMYTRE